MLEGAVNVLAPVSEKLGKLLRMLSSDKAGEVAAAVEAIRRTLVGADLSFHDLAGAIERPGGGQGDDVEALQALYRRGFVAGRAQGVELGRKEERMKNGLSPDPTWHEIAKECAAHPEVFKGHNEKTFVDDMIKRTVHGGEVNITERQAKWLRDIWTRVRR
jgi:hypothetical protein